jgi:hypothetical protein
MTGGLKYTLWLRGVYAASSGFRLDSALLKEGCVNGFEHDYLLSIRSWLGTYYCGQKHGQSVKGGGVESAFCKVAAGKNSAGLAALPVLV